MLIYLGICAKIFPNTICFIYPIIFPFGGKSMAFSDLSGILEELDLRTRAYLSLPNVVCKGSERTIHTIY